MRSLGREANNNKIITSSSIDRYHTIKVMHSRVTQWPWRLTECMKGIIRNVVAGQAMTCCRAAILYVIALIVQIKIG